MAASSPGNNIYTVLALIALIALICGIAIVWMRTAEVFPGTQPWQLEVSADLLRSVLRV